MAGSSGIRAGRTFVEAYLDDSRLQAGLRAASAKLKAFGSNVSGFGTGVTALGRDIASPMFAAAGAFASVGSELADMSARTGLTVENLSELGHAAGMTGTDLGAVEKGVRKMQKTLIEAANGSDTAQTAFGALGLSVDALMKMTPDQQFEAVAKAVGRVSNPTAKAAAAMSVFGKNNTALIPLIDDFDALTGEAKRLGLVMSTDDANAADKLGDALDVVSSMSKRFAVNVGAALAPALTDVAGRLANASKIALDWVNANRPMIATAFAVGVGLMAAGTAVVGFGVLLSGAGAVLGGIASGLGVLAAVVGTVLSPLGLVTAAVVGGAYAFLTYTDAGQSALASLGASFAGLTATATEAFTGIANALKAGDIALAGEILWVALKIEFQKGINFLNALWADWGVAFAQVFADASFTISGLMIDLSSGLEAIWVQLTHALGGSWGDLFAAMLKTMAPVVTALDALGFDASGKIGEGMKAAGLTMSDPAALQKDLAGVGQRNLDAHGALTDQQAAEAEARRKAAADGMGGGDAALADLQNQLGVLNDVAAENAAALPGDKLMSRTPKLGEEDANALDAGLADAAKKTVDVSGSFSAAFGGLGVGDSTVDVMKEQKKEQEKTNKELAKLNDKARAGRLIFTS